MSNQDRLLSDEELHTKIMNITGGHLYGHQNKDLLYLINTQKRLYAESVIGEDMKEYHPNAPFERNGVKMSPRGENQRIRNENNLRAEQRARIK